MRCVIASPERGVFDGAADAVLLPGLEGQIEVYAGHAPCLILLEAGEIAVRTGQSVRRFAVTGGYADISPEAVIVPAEEVVAVVG